MDVVTSRQSLPLFFFSGVFLFPPLLLHFNLKIQSSSGGIWICCSASQRISLPLLTSQLSLLTVTDLMHRENSAIILWSNMISSRLCFYYPPPPLLCLHLGPRVFQPGAVLLQPVMDVDARGQQSRQVFQRRGGRDLWSSLLQSAQHGERRSATRLYEARTHLQERAVAAGRCQGQQSIQLSHDWPAKLRGGMAGGQKAKTRRNNFNNRRNNLSVRQKTKKSGVKKIR